MPIYEYRCADCESDFETIVRSMISAETVTCPQCGSTRVKKAISLFGAASGGSKTGATAAVSSGAGCGPVG
jgi:putative FmdB family regulatory protein